MCHSAPSPPLPPAHCHQLTTTVKLCPHLLYAFMFFIKVYTKTSHTVTLFKMYISVFCNVIFQLFFPVFYDPHQCWHSGPSLFILIIAQCAVQGLNKLWSVCSTPTCRQWGYFCVGVCSVTQSCPTLFDPMDYSSPSSSVQARILEWGAISYSRGSSPPRDRIHFSCVSCIGRQILYDWATREALRCFYAVTIVDEPVSLSWTGYWSQLYHKEN